MKHEISEELLNAYIDNELSSADAHALAEQLKTDEQLNQRVKAMLSLKSCIKQSYPENKEHDKFFKRPLSLDFSYRFQAIAASVILGLGLLVGANLNTSTKAVSTTQHSADSSLFGIKMQPVSRMHNKILLHISSAELDKLNFLLSKTESLLRDAKNSQQSLDIQVVANSDGINLLRKDMSPYAAKIKELQDTYTNIQFIACSNTIKRLQETGQKVNVFDGVRADTPALDTIINRMDKGWTYVKI